MSLPFTPVIIIGAARSGTNMLRDMLCALPDFATWPCDELNPVWRHGNRNWPDDELPADFSERSRGYIRRRFLRRWRQAGNCRFVVEKTCANSLRVSFVTAVLPEARFVQIVRDGMDVVASAEKRWRGILEVNPPRYFLSKARYAPLSDLPSLGLEFIAKRWPMHTGRSEVLGTWGPRFTGIDQMLAKPVCEICAWQWVACTQRSDAALASLSRKNWLKIRYEDVVTAPKAVLREVMCFLMAHQVGSEAIENASAIVSAGSADRRRTPALGGRVSEILQATRAKHGYPI